ncbi:MAG: tail fiber domain-containing protein [Phycisphaerae bacterium]
MKRILFVLVAACVLPTGPALAQTPVSTHIHYQGRLDDNGSPANGTYDLEFRLYDVASGGTHLGPVICTDNRLVTDGEFEIALDFGDQYDGNARWLQIAVRPDNTAGNCFGGPYTTLGPRQPLRAAPFALHALNAGQWSSSGSDITNTNTGFVGINRTNTVGLEWFGVHAPVNSGYGGMYITTEGATAWPFYGYKAGTQAAWTYLDGGTGDWHVNVDGNKLTVTDEGNVGIRTTAPAYPLHVNGSTADRTIHAENAAASGSALRGEATHTASSNVGVWGQSASTLGSGIFGFATATSGAPAAVRGDVDSPTGYGAYFTGVAGSRNFFERRVGIGTDSPAHLLHVTENATTNAIHGQNAGAGAGVFGHQAATTGIRDGVGGRTDSSAGRGVFGWATSAIGNAYGVQGQTDSNAGRALYGIATAASGTTYGCRAEVNSASGYAAYFEGPVGSQNYFERAVGIGTTNPGSTLSVNGTADILGPVSIGITGADARLLVRGVTGEDAFRVRVDSSTKLLVKDNGGVGIGANFGTLPDNGLRTAGAVGIGADPGSFTLLCNGDAAKPGGGLWSSTCDARLKREITPLAPGTLDRLLSLNGYEFEYVADVVASGLGLPGRQVGLIAQEVQQAFPGWVDADDQGYLYVTERGLTAIIVEALRELRAEKDAAVDALRAENDELRARLARIEARLADDVTADDATK